MPRPKPTPTERFQVSCEVEAAQLGSVVAHFTKMGLPNVHFELITDIKTFRNNTRRDEPITSLVAPNQTAEQILMPWLKDHPTFKAIEAAHHLSANGSSRSAAYPALKVLVEKKILKALGSGNYTRTDVKHLAAPKKKHAAKKAAKAKPAKVAKKKVFDITNGEAILRVARRGHGKTTFENLKRHFESEGRNVASIHPTIKDLVGKKLLKRNGNASYEVITPPVEAKTENVEATHAA